MRIVIALAAIVAAASSWAADFGQSFSDSTLRIDYVLSGSAGDPIQGKAGTIGISLRGISSYANWAGRRDNLTHPLYTGYGDITVTTASGDTIYANSFSSLYNEWLDLGEALPRSGECPLLIPMPRQTVTVTTRLLDKRHNPIASIEHPVDPADILIRKRGGNPAPHTYIHRASYDGPHIGVAIMAEGYAADDMESFMSDAKAAADAILSHKPFDRYADRIDIIAVQTPSAQSGVSIPKDSIWVDTAFGSHFSTFYSDRYLTSPDLFKMYDALAGIPAQHLIILANTPQYGGGGIFNAYTLTAAKHPAFRPVVVHEFGHSFGGLADEYFYDGDTFDDTYPLDVEPWEPNITTLVDFGSKWQPLLSPSTPVPTPAEMSEKYPVGAYEGGGYSSHGIYRPADVCRMRKNDVPDFCPACQSALERIILYYTQPLDPAPTPGDSPTGAQRQ